MKLIYLVSTVPVYRLSRKVAKDANREKKTPNPRTTPYPAPMFNGGVPPKELVIPIYFASA